MSRLSAEPPDPSTRDEVEHWVRQIQARSDVEANSERLYSYCHPRVISHFSEKGFDPPRCEELAQDVLLLVFKSIDSFQHRAGFTTWLFEILHSVYANEIRRIKAAKRSGHELPLREEHDDDEEHTAVALESRDPSPLAATLRREESAALHAAWQKLPPQMQRCVVLRVMQDLKYREIAEVLNVSLDTVKAHLGQAKIRLRKLLGDRAPVVAALAQDRPDGPHRIEDNEDEEGTP